MLRLCFNSVVEFLYDELDGVSGLPESFPTTADTRSLRDEDHSKRNGKHYSCHSDRNILVVANRTMVNNNVCETFIQVLVYC